MSKEAGAQTEASFVTDTEDVVDFLLSLPKEERQRVFSTSKTSLKNALDGLSAKGCSRCSFTKYVYTLFDAQESMRASSTWMALPPGRLMSLLCPPQILTPMQFVWNEDRVYLGETLVGEDRLFRSFLSESLCLSKRSGSLGGAGTSRHLACDHKTSDAPKQEELDCSMRRLNVQESQVARLEMFCDQLLLDYGADLAVVEAEDPGSTMEIESLLNEKSSLLEFEQRLKDFETRLEAEYKSRSALAKMKKQIQLVTKQIIQRKQRLEAAACFSIENGSKRLLRLLLDLCWKRSFSEYYANKALSMSELEGSAGAAGQEATALQVVMSMSAQQIKTLMESHEEVRARLQDEEAKTEAQAEKLAGLQEEVRDLTEKLGRADPSESALRAMPMDRLNSVMAHLEETMERVRIRKDRVLEQQSKCCICWAREKEIVFLRPPSVLHMLGEGRRVSRLQKGRGSENQNVLMGVISCQDNSCVISVLAPVGPKNFTPQPYSHPTLGSPPRRSDPGIRSRHVQAPPEKNAGGAGETKRLAGVRRGGPPAHVSAPPNPPPSWSTRRRRPTASTRFTCPTYPSGSRTTSSPATSSLSMGVSRAA